MSEYYWHFVQVDDNNTPRLGYGDNREVRVGETLSVEGVPALCEHGLHASRRLIDALYYATGDRLSLCRVTLGGTVLHDDDKSVATERTVVAMLDADSTDKLLRDFARWCALQVIHLWDAPDVVRQYLTSGDESLRSAVGTAARVAAGSAARDAARYAAWNAAWAATRDAARYAARYVAGTAARYAARAAAWNAARYAAWNATWAADWGAAWNAAREQYATELERRGLEAMGETEKQA